MLTQRIHQNQPVLTAGTDLKDAQGAVILLHGRGGMAQSMLNLAAELPQERIAYLAPQAANQTWYPNSGFIPIEGNEPYVSSAFETIDALLAQVRDAGIPLDKIILGGFSQGACLAAEYVARHPGRYGGLIAFSGALMGPADAPRQYPGSLDGTPVFITGSEQDSWVTDVQLHLTAKVMKVLGGAVRLDIQPGGEHTIRPNEIAAAHSIIAEALG